MTGNEFDDTIELSSRFILPMLTNAGVRLVQVARGGLQQHDGIIVLDDTNAPEQLHPRGPVALSDELLLAGTVATQANGLRRCSQKWKGWPIDTWVAEELGDQPYRHIIGYHAGERYRIERDRSYGTHNRHPEYPLFAWGGTRTPAGSTCWINSGCGGQIQRASTVFSSLCCSVLIRPYLCEDDRRLCCAFARLECMYDM